MLNYILVDKSIQQFMFSSEASSNLFYVAVGFV